LANDRVDTARGREKVQIEETHNQNGAVNKLEHPIHVTPELLLKYGVPFKERFELEKDTCPAVS
jgi:hypothetical protein